MSETNTTTAIETIHRDDGNNNRASWNFSADQIITQTKHFAPEETEALVGLFRWCTDPAHSMHIQDAAAWLGCSPNLLYQLSTGKYREPDSKEPKRPSKALMSKINDFLSTNAERFMDGKREFVLTPTAKKIVTALDLARESQTIVIIYGPSHIGKTWTAEKHYQPSNNHGRTIYCRMKAASGLGGMVRAMCAAAGLSDKCNTADSIQRIKNATTPNTLWILDEMHLLANTYRKGSFFACIEVVREIHDVTKCGMELFFTILDELKAASQKELQQVWRRGVHKVPLPVMPTKGDIGAILKHNGFTGDPVADGGGVFPPRDLKITVGSIVESPYEILRSEAKTNGLKAITERIRYARKLADRAKTKVTDTHLVNAHLIIQKNAQQEGEWS